MIDLHVHVLPGIDDGPADTVASLMLAQAAAAGGTAVLVATPHLHPAHPAVRLDELAGRVAELNGLLSWYDVGVRVISGAEIDLGVAATLSDEELGLASLGGTGDTVLIETPLSPLTPLLGEVVDDIVRRGFRPLLAHPERNPTLQRHPEPLAELVERGALVQVTAAAIDGPRFSRIRRVAVRAVREGWAHVLASDSHDAHVRPPELRPALARIEHMLGDDASVGAWMTEGVPAAILAGEALPARPEVVA